MGACCPRCPFPSLPMITKLPYVGTFAGLVLLT
ncbi:MAG: hypothetical protein ACJAZN_000537, partial [Planctomycetota bacterium]